MSVVLLLLLQLKSLLDATATLKEDQTDFVSPSQQQQKIETACQHAKAFKMLCSRSRGRSGVRIVQAQRSIGSAQRQSVNWQLVGLREATLPASLTLAFSRLLLLRRKFVANFQQGQYNKLRDY